MFHGIFEKIEEFENSIDENLELNELIAIKDILVTDRVVEENMEWFVEKVVDIKKRENEETAEEIELFKKHVQNEVRKRDRLELLCIAVLVNTFDSDYYQYQFNFSHVLERYIDSFTVHSNAKSATKR